MSKALDALVAERVMAWKLRRANGYESWWTHDSIGRTKKHLAHKWSPSTDIAAAMEVFAACDGVRDIHKSDLSTRKHSVRWFDGMKGESVYGESLPECICIAALRAVGVDESEIEKARAGT